MYVFGVVESNAVVLIDVLISCGRFALLTRCVSVSLVGLILVALLWVLEAARLVDPFADGPSVFGYDPFPTLQTLLPLAVYLADVGRFLRAL